MLEGGLFRKRVFHLSHWKPRESRKPREPRDEILKTAPFPNTTTTNLTFPTLQKDFANIFSYLPGNFALKNRGDFW